MTGSGPGRLLLGLVGLAVVAGLAFWAGRVSLEPAEVVVQTPDASVLVEVVEQEVGQVLTLTTTVTRPSRPLAVNAVPGVVRAVAEDGEHGQGDVLYRVGGAAVILVQGETPFWRDLAEDSTGSDVRQVQQLLNAQGAELPVDGVWGSEMTEAVEEWQGELGADVTGVLPLGHLVAAPELPVSVSIDGEVAWPGAVLSGGEPVVSVAAGEPTFLMEVNDTQAEMISTGTTVTVKHETFRWEGVIAESVTTELGVNLSVLGPDGGLVCGTDCAALPATGDVFLLTDVAVIPPVSGPVVPVAAITTRPDGSTSVDVMGQDGTVTTQAVTVLTVADGIAVVDGVQAGQQVRVLGGGGPPPAPTDAEPTTGLGHAPAPLLGS